MVLSLLMPLMILKKALVSFKYNCEAYNNNGNKWLLFDVNKKKGFLDVQKTPKAPHPKKNPKEKIPAWLGYKTIDFII